MGNLAGPDDMLGPSKVIEVPGGLLMDPTMQDPPEPEEGTEVSVVLIDALAEVAAHLKVMVPAQHDPASMYTFLSTRPDIYPCKHVAISREAIGVEASLSRSAACLKMAKDDLGF